MLRLRGILGAALIAGVPAATLAQDTLADVRQDLAVLSAEMQRVQRELSTTGASSIALPANALDRINTIEAELQRLTGLTEQLQFRIETLVSDGTNRIGDLQFRVCELDPTCDLSTLGTAAPLGGGNAAPAPALPSGTQSGGPELAIGEETDLRRAQEALASRDFRSAVDQLASFRETYPGSPLEPQVLLVQGQALEGLGDIREAARAYLALYSGYPNSAAAPLALTRLGISLGALGKLPEACVTLAEVASRYPGAEAVPEAQQAMTDLGCT